MAAQKIRKRHAVYILSFCFQQKICYSGYKVNGGGGTCWALDPALCLQLRRHGTVNDCGKDRGRSLLAKRSACHRVACARHCFKLQSHLSTESTLRQEQSRTSQHISLFFVDYIAVFCRSWWRTPVSSFTSDIGLSLCNLSLKIARFTLWKKNMFASRKRSLYLVCI